MSIKRKRNYIRLDGPQPQPIYIYPFMEQELDEMVPPKNDRNIS